MLPGSRVQFEQVVGDGPHVFVAFEHPVYGGDNWWIWGLDGSTLSAASA